MKKEIIIKTLLFSDEFVKQLKDELTKNNISHKILIYNELPTDNSNCDIIFFNIGKNNTFSEYENFLINQPQSTKTIFIGEKNSNNNKFAINTKAYLFLSSPINFELLNTHLKNILLEKELWEYQNNQTIVNIDNNKYIHRNLETLHLSLISKISKIFINRVEIEALAKVVFEFIDDIFNISYASLMIDTENYKAIRFYGILKNRIPLNVRQNINTLASNLIELSDNSIFNFLKNKDFIETNNYITKEPKHIINIPLSSTHIHNKLNTYGYISFYITDNNSDALIYKDLLSLLISSISYFFNNALYMHNVIDRNQKDNITNLFNHAATISSIGQELEKIKRYGGSIGVAMISIDNADLIRRKYDIREQDKIFVKISSIITIELRKSDFAGLIRGNTYLLLLFNNNNVMNKTKLNTAISRIKAKLDNIKIIGLNNFKLETSFAGVVINELSSNLNVVSLIQALENNLLEAKQLNNIKISEL